MSNQILICDTSAIIVLEKLGKLILLKELFDEVLITNEIKLEYGEYLPDWIKIEKPSDLLKSKILILQLDPGEASAISLALEKENPTLLIDERKGRKIASLLGLRITGTLGILIKAKRTGKIPKIKPLIDMLIDLDFRISKSLINKVLQLSDELDLT